MSAKKTGAVKVTNRPWQIDIHNKFAENWTTIIKLCIKSRIYRTILCPNLGAKAMALNLSENFGGISRAAVVAIPLVLASFGAAATGANADDGQSAQLHNAALQTGGKPVTLRVGPGYDPDLANLLAATLNSQGCPTTVTTERGFPGHVTVDIDGFKPSKFTDSELGDTGLVAERLCLGT